MVVTSSTLFDIEGQPTENLDVHVAASNLMSGHPHVGSTGPPKGVLVTHDVAGYS